MPRTAEDLAALPDDGRQHELVAGCLVAEPPAGYRHGKVEGRIHALLAAFVESRDLGVVCPGDTGFVLARGPDTVRAPDVSFVTKERDRAVAHPEKFFPGAPDLAVEVLSPEADLGEVRAKAAEYLAAGSRLVWVVDPEARQVTTYRSILSPRILGCDQELDGEDVLPGFRCLVSGLFE